MSRNRRYVDTNT